MFLKLHWAGNHKVFIIMRNIKSIMLGVVLVELSEVVHNFPLSRVGISGVAEAMERRNCG
jgi:hypothetical protein